MNVTKTAQKIGLFSALGLLGIAGLQQIPQPQLQTPLAAAATYGYQPDFTPKTLYSTPAQLVNHYSNRINVRKGPGTDYSIRHYGIHGDRVTLLNDANGNDGDRWYYLSFNQSGAEGWVREDLLSEQTVFPEQDVRLKSKEPNIKINVRSGPGTNHSIRYTGVHGEPVILRDSREGNDGYVWYELSFVYSDAIGWVRSDLLDFVED